MTLDYVLIPIQILTLKGYSLSKKILLSLVASFNEKGLRMSNDALAKILDVRPTWISDLLCDLESKGDVIIKNRHSRHRVIYLREKSKVGDILLSTKTVSKKVLLSTLTPSTYDLSRNITKGTKEKRIHESKTSVQKLEASFDRFWSAYPKKVAKIEAQKVWAKLNPSKELVEQILDSVDVHKQTRQWLKEDGRFIPHPATFLSQHRWEDVIATDLPTHNATPEEIAALEAEGIL